MQAATGSPAQAPWEPDLYLSQALMRRSPTHRPLVFPPTVFQRNSPHHRQISRQVARSFSPDVRTCRHSRPARIGLHYPSKRTLINRSAMSDMGQTQTWNGRWVVRRLLAMAHVHKTPTGKVTVKAAP